MKKRKTPIRRTGGRMKNGKGTSARHALGFSDEVRSKLGLGPKQKLPPEGMEESKFLPTQWGLVETWINPLSPNRRRGQKKHRTVVMCPKCAKQLSAGRLAQHMQVHPEQSPAGAKDAETNE